MFLQDLPLLYTKTWLDVLVSLPFINIYQKLRSVDYFDFAFFAFLSYLMRLAGAFLFQQHIHPKYIKKID
jgi:hypothetical protein